MTIRRLLSLWMLGAVVLAAGCGNGNQKIPVEVTLGQYKGIEVEIPEVSVTKEEVEQGVQGSLKALATEQEVTDRPVKEGDTVNIDYVGKKDGAAFEGGTDSGSVITIGSGSFIPGFEEGIIGHRQGETFDIDVTFPEGYQNAELAGADAVFTITLHKVTESVVPKLTDELVKSISEEYQTVAEYRAYIEERLLKSKQSSAEETAYSEAWAKVLDEAEVAEIPEEMLERRYEKQYQYFRSLSDSQGIELEQFLEMMGFTKEKFEADIRERARQIEKELLVAQKIAEVEKLAVTEEELKEAVALYVAQYGSEEAFRENTDMELFEEQVLKNKVYRFVADNLVKK